MRVLDTCPSEKSTTPLCGASPQKSSGQCHSEEHLFATRNLYPVWNALPIGDRDGSTAPHVFLTAFGMTR